MIGEGASGRSERERQRAAAAAAAPARGRGRGTPSRACRLGSAARFGASAGGLALALLFVAFAFTTSPPTVAAAAGEPAGGATGQTVRIEVVGAPADAVTATADLEEGSWVIEPPAGFVRLTTDETAIVARSLRLTGAGEGGQVAELAGSVRVARPDLYAAAETLRVDMQEGRYTFDGTARLYRWTAKRRLHAERLALEGGDGGLPPPSSAAWWGDWIGEPAPSSEPLSLAGDRVTFEEESGSIDGSGSVHVKDASIEAWSDAFSYDPDADRAVLTGSVRAIMEGHTIDDSPRLVVELEEERAEIAGPWRATIAVEGDGEE